MLKSGVGNALDGYWIRHAENMIKKTYGDIVSVEAKGKDLIKFGKSDQVGTTAATGPVELQILPGGQYQETVVTSNVINQMTFTTDADSGLIIYYEGHTISAGGILTFVTGTLQSLGQSKTTISPPLYAINRFKNVDTRSIVGRLFIAQSTAVTNGVPGTLSRVHMMSNSGDQNSRKCKTCISNSDYFILSGVYLDVAEKASAFALASFELKDRSNNGLFLQQFELSASDASGTFRTGVPLVVVPKNCEIRMTATAGGANTDVTAGFFGVLASVIGTA